MAGAAATLDARSQQKRAFWLKHLHQWHWVSAAACLVGLVLFSLTGFTLNHASAIGAEPEVTTRTAVLPNPLQQELQKIAAAEPEPTGVPSTLKAWLREAFSVAVDDAPVEWSSDELYISLPRPGGDAWLSIDLASV